MISDHYPSHELYIFLYPISYVLLVFSSLVLVFWTSNCLLSWMQTEDVNGEAIYSGILKVVKFICSSLCFGNVTWIHSFGRLTWPRISELIISKFLSKVRFFIIGKLWWNFFLWTATIGCSFWSQVVPEDASKLADFQKVIERTSQFETALKELSFISPSDAEGRLSKYAENVEVHFASRKKIEILAKARSLMLQCNFTIPKVSLSSYLPHQHVKDHDCVILFSGTCYEERQF